MGAIGGAIAGGIKKRNDQQKAAEAEAAQAEANATRVINVPNSNGSFTPVTLHLEPNGWQGPKGEVYPTLPTSDQLKKAYGIQ